MPFSRSLICLLSVVVLLLGCGPREQPITMICPWAAGGGTDQLSRYWASALEEKLGRPGVVINKTGGSGCVGHTAGANAKADGATITMITFELSTMKQMGVCPMTHENFRPVMQVNADPAAIIVQNDAPWKNLREFLDHIKSHPKEVKMSGTAAGGAWDLARAGLLQADGVAVDAVIWVPTNGAAPSLTELLGGHIQAVCCSLPEAADQLSSGQLRALTVMADERMEDYPDLPTSKEEGVEWTAVGWRGLALPKDVSDEQAAAIETACLEIAETDDFRQFMKKTGFQIEIKNAADFGAFLAEQEGQWKKVVEAAGYAQ